MLIGITGTLGSGKGTVVDYLKKKYGFVHYSGSAKLRSILEKRGELIDRDAYSKLATEIRKQDPQGLAKMLFADIERDTPEHAVIEALHDIGEATFVKDKGGIIIGVDADIEKRYERVIRRGSEKDHISFEHFREQIVREEEGSSYHNIRAVLKVADYTILNNDSLQQLHNQIQSILTKEGL